jgi:TldD protein
MQSIRVREERVSESSDGESIGVAVRTLVDGAWGYASSNQVTRDECRRLAEQAAMRGRVSSRGLQRRIELASVDGYPAGRWMTPIRSDPFRVPMGEKTELLIAANQEALQVSGVRSVTSALYFERTETTFASTDGSIIEQTLYRTNPSMTVTAFVEDASEAQARSSAEVPPMGKGYEHVIDADLVGRARQWGEEAVEKVTAATVEPGSYDLVLDPSNLSLTIHETIGHPTELDRALGYEANHVGSSFLSPPAEVLGKLRLGPSFMNVVGNRTERGGLATVGWDDEGVPADSWPIIEDGVLVDFQTTREQAPLISDLTGVTRSHGCSHAESWDSVQFQRMPNLSLMPGEDNKTLDDLVAATDNGILIKGHGSHSVDNRGYGFRFGGQSCHEIRNGVVGRMLKNVAYQGNTPGFWNSLDMLGGPQSYSLGGTMNDRKGQPVQTSSASHGCPPGRFVQVDVINMES